MTLNKFQAGINTAFSTELNQNGAEAITLSGLTTIRQIKDRSITFSKGSLDWFGDYFSDASGMLDYVDTSRTLTTSGYLAASQAYSHGVTNTSASDTTHDPDTFTSPSNAFDSDFSTSATKSLGPISGGGGLGSVSLGKTFSAKVPGLVKVYATITTGGSWTVQPTCTITLETYNGSVWSAHTTLASATSSASFDGAAVVSTSVQGLRLTIGGTGTASGANNGSGTITIYELDYGTAITDGEVTLNIPTGTFSGTVSSAILVPFFASWETGANLQYKLTNTSEDSGWLACGNAPTITEFTAFTTEPTKIKLKIMQKSSTPTPGVPSLNGFVVRAA